MENLYGLQIRDRRRKLNGRKTYQIKQLWDRHHEMFRLAILGAKHTDIAKILGVTPTCVSQCLNSDIGKAKLSIMRGARDAEAFEVSVEVKRMLPKAMEIYRKIIESTDDPKISMSLKKATADTIVKELGGHEAPKKIAGVHAHFSLDEIEDIKKRGKELAGAAGALRIIK